MTVDTFVPLPGYTVMGVGPYGIDWPYGAGAVPGGVSDGVESVGDRARGSFGRAA
jgi:hypothetical protein